VNPRGLVLVLSAPSGAGKHAVIARVREFGEPLVETVSATTRAPRRGETDGVAYHFVDEATFRRLVAEGAFVEWAEVHGHLYGTLKSELDHRIESGRDVVLELDVQGMRALKRARDDVVSVFLMPPSIAELERRLRKRGLNDEADIAVRLRNAEKEIAARHESDYIIVNDDLDQAAREFIEVLRLERAARTRNAVNVNKERK